MYNACTKVHKTFPFLHIKVCTCIHFMSALSEGKVMFVIEPVLHSWIILIACVNFPNMLFKPCYTRGIKLSLFVPAPSWPEDSTPRPEDQEHFHDVWPVLKTGRPWYCKVRFT